MAANSWKLGTNKFSIEMWAVNTQWESAPQQPGTLLGSNRRGGCRETCIPSSSHLFSCKATATYLLLKNLIACQKPSIIIIALHQENPEGLEKIAFPPFSNLFTSVTPQAPVPLIQNSIFVYSTLKTNSKTNCMSVEEVLSSTYTLRFRSVALGND